jgi:lipopolysaccharide transport system permease protein
MPDTRAVPQRPGIGLLRELADHWDLLYMITLREVKIKYKQSVMGFSWAILMPMVIVSAGIIVRYAFSRLSGEPLTLDDMARVSVKAVPWAFLVSSIRFASSSLVANTNLVTKIYMPREIFPIASILSQLIDFAVASCVLTAVLVVARAGASLQLLWLPWLVIVLILLAAGFGLFLSAAGLFFRDVKYIVEVILTFAIFFTPVFYDVSMFGRWATILLLNPAAPILEGFSAVVVGHTPPNVGWLAYSSGFALLSVTLAWAFFKRVEPYFAESV